MAQILIIGGTGYAGGNIAREAVARGHSVTSLSRSAPTDPIAGVTYRTGSITDAALVAELSKDADQLVVAVHGADAGGRPLIDTLLSLIDTAVASGARLSFVGGSGSTFVSEGGPLLIDTPDFNEDWKPEASSHAKVLSVLRDEDHPGLAWFYVSPAALFGAWTPGETLGTYRSSDDILITKADGSSEISGTDFAKAYVDEIEQVNHVNKRFTVGH